MSANEIESVEIIPNPPARYDAAVNAGILNIKTKRIEKSQQWHTYSFSQPGTAHQGKCGPYPEPSQRKSGMSLAALLPWSAVIKTISILTASSRVMAVRKISV